MDKPEIKITADGSHTLYLKSLDETYHSIHGAIQEAIHVYINAGFNYYKNRAQLNVLEVGFGTGLNAFLTYQESLKNNIEVNYTSIEAYPLQKESIDKLNYLSELNVAEKEIKLFNKLHEAKWNENEKITGSFSLTKLELMLQDFTREEQYDVIYFDAFGPRVQPELWETSILQQMFNALKVNGVLVTYCAKGSVKRALKEVGFKIESIPGPPGKREMTRAIK